MSTNPNVPTPRVAQMTPEKMAHEAMNAAHSITFAVEVLRSIPEALLTPAQARAITHTSDSVQLLIEIMDAMEATSGRRDV